MTHDIWYYVGIVLAIYLVIGFYIGLFRLLTSDFVFNLWTWPWRRGWKTVRAIGRAIVHPRTQAVTP